MPTITTASASITDNVELCNAIISRLSLTFLDSSATITIKSLASNSKMKQLRLEKQDTQLELPIKVIKRGNPNFTPIWKEKTKVVRVPARFKDAVKDICKQWQLEESNSTSSRTSKVTEIPIKDIKCDPSRFQFKLLHDSNSGSSGSLKGIKQWNPDLAGLILVWEDQQDGSIYVINGHNRLNLASKLGVEMIAVRFISASNAKQARIIGAMANIAEGNGSAIDAAKLIRDTGLTIDEIKDYGINLKSKLANDGLNLSNLDSGLFEKVLTGEIEINVGIAIGSVSLDRQWQLWELIKKRGQSLTNETLTELIETVNSASNSSSNSVTLFGNELMVESNALERAELQSYIVKSLKKQSRLFNAASKPSNADILSSANNNIDTATSADRYESTMTDLELFNQFKNVASDISTILNRYADQLKTGKGKSKIKQNCLNEITAALSGYHNQKIA